MVTLHFGMKVTNKFSSYMTVYFFIFFKYHNIGIKLSTVVYCLSSSSKIKVYEVGLIFIRSCYRINLSGEENLTINEQIATTVYPTFSFETT